MPSCGAANGRSHISGGEPTLLRERLVALVKRARARGIPFVELQTNAVLLDEGYASELAPGRAHLRLRIPCSPTFPSTTMCSRA